MRKRLIVILALAAVAAVACGGSGEEESLSRAEARGFFANIDSLLDQTVAEHDQGNTEEAAEFAGQAYLDNFEHLEPDLGEVDQELNEEIEGLLGPPFRQAIQGGMTQDELEARVSEVRTLLEQARAALGVE